VALVLSACTPLELAAPPILPPPLGSSIAVTGFQVGQAVELQRTPTIEQPGRVSPTMQSILADPYQTYLYRRQQAAMTQSCMPDRTAAARGGE
jgi:hypothetical protein